MTDACLCGRQGCDNPTPICTLCSTLNRGRPNHTVTAPACSACRAALAAIPGDIAAAHAMLDQLLTPRRGATDTRQATAEAPIPLAVDPYDLLAEHTLPQGPLRRARLAANAADQVGHLPVAVVLHSWVRDWCELRDLGEQGPHSAWVEGQARWLGERTEWAVDHHPAVHEYATELAELRGVLLGVVGRGEACPKCEGAGCEDCHQLGAVPQVRPQRIPGVPCPRCRHVTLLRRSDGWTECTWSDCASVFSPEDYGRVTRAVATAIQRGLVDVSGE